MLCTIAPKNASQHVSRQVILTLRHGQRRLSSVYAEKAPEILLTQQNNPDLPGAIVSLLTLNRPKANAMGGTMLKELQESIQTLGGENSSRCVVLTSSSVKVFSAGADLKERANMTLEEAETFVEALRTTFYHLSRLPMPVIAAVEGVAVGGGLELALSADFCVASSTATFGLPETSLAIIPGAGGTQRLPRQLSMARAKELIFTAARFDSRTAYEYGLVNHVVEAGQAEARALEIAWKIAQNGPVAIRAAKKAIDVGMEAPNLRQALEVEKECYSTVLQTEDRLEGLAAFKEGRPPKYWGK